MSKAGRQRRTPEERILAKDKRSTIKYIERIRNEVAEEQFENFMKELAQKESEKS